MLIKKYATYADLISDQDPGCYGVIESTGTMFKRVDGKWRLGCIVPNDPVISAHNSVTGDYTAFEVYAHSNEIPVGESEVLGGYVTNAIPAGMKHDIRIKTAINNPSTSDIVVDWGDGTTNILTNCVAVSEIANELTEYVVNSAAEGDVAFDVSHPYAADGKFIVKIYGKDYYNIYSPRTTTDDRGNLICRVLDTDLPVAPHVTNMASFARSSDHLLKVRLPEYFNVSNWLNVVSLFQNCKNLLSITGFKQRFTTLHSLQYFMCNTSSLKECDLTIPPVLFRDGKAFYNFASGCNYVDLDTLFSNGALDGSTNINMAQAFMNAKFKEGTVIPANKLWGDKTKVWESTTKAFKGCDPEIRAQVPKSWGGDNANIDIELSITDEMKKDYTAFEVYPTSKVMAPGEFSYLGYTNSVEIPAQDTHHFVLRSLLTQDKQDVIIDWGDGTFTDVKAGGDDVIVKLDYSDTNFFIKHKYAEPDKPYIVKIYGTTYFGFMGENNTRKIDDGSGDAESYKKHNLISRIFDIDLPVASCLTNTASMCLYANRLLKVYVYGHAILRQSSNWTLTFNACKNLVYAGGFEDDNFCPAATTQVFASCSSLTYSDFRLPVAPRSSSVTGTMYKGCTSLTMDVEKLLPKANFFTSPYEMTQMFYESGVTISAETAEEVASKLWNNPNITFTGISKVFGRCSAETKASVPVSWCGTAPDSIITVGDSDLSEAVNELTTRVSNVENNIADVTELTERVTSVESGIEAIQTHLGIN